jgi:EAL domain-containing protein (putative c-di-GMP-specific phosphodiesterase class I)
LTDMVLDAALRQASEWPDKWGNLSVAVNVSTHALREPALPELILEALNNWHFQPELLTLEITESAFMSDFEVSYLNLNIIRNSGVRISVDDFGTGYSCLSQFKRIPADELKIDKSFVYDMIDDEQNKHIVDLIIELAHRFNLKAVAEGIEEMRTLETLIDAGCDYGQGFLFGQSMPQSIFIEWIRQFKRIM